jgi:hypothetical protein
MGANNIQLYCINLTPGEGGGGRKHSENNWFRCIRQ